MIAQRPARPARTPIVILAHRDAAARGSEAELSGTAALIELARVFAARETQRTIILVSTSGGSGGDAGAAGLRRAASNGPLDAAIVLGDVAGARERKPFVVPYSDGFGRRPLSSCSARSPARSCSEAGSATRARRACSGSSPPGVSVRAGRAGRR